MNPNPTEKKLWKILIKKKTRKKERKKDKINLQRNLEGGRVREGGVTLNE